MSPTVVGGAGTFNFNLRRKETSKEEARGLNEIRQQAMQDFPPLEPPPGIPSRLREARRTKKLTWRAGAQAAGISDPSVVGGIALGYDTHVSDLEAVARVLDLRLESVAVDAG